MKRVFTIMEFNAGMQEIINHMGDLRRKLMLGE
jgi:hypothetical protein